MASQKDVKIQIEDVFPHLSPLLPVINNEQVDNDKATSYLLNLEKDSYLYKNPTRTKKTEEFYRYIWDTQIIAKLNKDSDYLGFEPIIALYEDLSTRVGAGTFRLYRSAGCFMMGEHTENAAALKSIKSKLSKKRPKVGPAKKKRTISAADMTILMDELHKEDTPMSRQVMLYCQVSITTGLRPSEWMSATLVGDELIIKNAKNSNNRACGDYRTLSLSDKPDVREVQKNLISQYLDLIPQTSEKDFAGFNKNTYAGLRYYSKKILGDKKALCLYTMRHQYSATMKANYPKSVVAIAMGHRSEDTAGRNYSPKRHAWPDEKFALVGRHENVLDNKKSNN